MGYFNVKILVMLKTFVRATISIIVLTTVWIRLDDILGFKNTNGIYDMTKLYEQDANSVDVLILGSSHAFESFNTPILWDEYGIAAFDLCGSVQPMWNSYHYLVEALKTQHPRLIILEGTQVVHIDDYSLDSDIVANNNGLRWSLNKVSSLLASLPKGRRDEFLPEYVQYHRRYSELSKADFSKGQGDPWLTDWKGFGANTRIRPYEGNDLSQITEIGYMSEKSEWYYTRIMELAQQEGIPLEIVITPYPNCIPEEQRILNRAEEIATEKGVPFMNCNMMLDEIGIDLNTDSADEYHINYKGSEKFSRFIGNYLDAKYDLPDRRGDDNYISWQRHADYYKRQHHSQ